MEQRCPDVFPLFVKSNINMVKAWLLNVVVLSILVAGCGAPKGKEAGDPLILQKDDHSFANFNEVRVNHISLDLTVDFDQKVLSGSARLSLNNITETNTLVLDVGDLSVNEIILDNGEATTFSLGKESEIFGQSLSIAIEPTTEWVEIKYATSPEAKALQWLSPEQTLGKEHPFLFSQSQAILARTWVPCQDGPGVKFTYDAKITTDSSLIALMSAENGTTKNADGIYTFKMDQPISSYLLALTVGDLEYQRMGRNSGVFAEPAMLEKSVYELESMQRMIDSAETLYGPYAWEQYDVVILPPSFPFGGMENPRLTFATPTIIAGDRSLVSLIAHELAHSWSGNLVTNETWNDFWLNEGFTVYFEQRIMEKIYGSSYERMLTKLGMGDLVNTIAELEKEGKLADTHLYLELDGRDPDDGLTDVAYEKGRFFLQTVESIVGRERFDSFLRTYFTVNKFKPMNTERFLNYLNDNLLSDEESVDLGADEWIYGPGLPDNCPEPFSEELDKVESSLAKYNNGLIGADKLVTDGYTTHHWLYFLRGLRNLDGNKMTELDAAFSFTETGNSEIACDWFKHVVDQSYKPAYPAMASFLKSVGRRKFLTPIYSRLAATPENKLWAMEVYEFARPSYHSVSYITIDGILK